MTEARASESLGCATTDPALRYSLVDQGKATKVKLAMSLLKPPKCTPHIVI